VVGRRVVRGVWGGKMWRRGKVKRSVEVERRGERGVM
jgi:hypothetical protein